MGSPPREKQLARDEPHILLWNRNYVSGRPMPGLVGPNLMQPV